MPIDTSSWRPSTNVETGSQPEWKKVIDQIFGVPLVENLQHPLQTPLQRTPLPPAPQDIAPAFGLPNTNAALGQLLLPSQGKS
jgi:hypothetical protein